MREQLTICSDCSEESEATWNAPRGRAAGDARTAGERALKIRDAACSAKSGMNISVNEIRMEPDKIGKESGASKSDWRNPAQISLSGFSSAKSGDSDENPVKAHVSACQNPVFIRCTNGRLSDI